MRKYKILSLILSALMLCSLFTGCKVNNEIEGKQENITLNESQLKATKTSTEEVLTSGKFSGTAFVTLGTQNIYLKSFGYTDKEKKTGITNDNIYQIGSLSKAFTGVAILKLEKEGKLEFTDTLDKYFKGKDFLSNITIQHLLEMRSGLASYTTKIPENKTIYNQIMQAINTNPEDTEIKNYVRDFIFLTGLEEETGSFYYSHSDYYLLGLIIESVTGKSYQAYITENIIKPLKLENTSFIKNDKKFYGYAIDGNYHSSEYNKYLNNKHIMFSSLGILSNIKDVNIFYNAVINNKIKAKNGKSLDFLNFINNSSSGYSCGFYQINNCLYAEGNTSLHSGVSYINKDTKEIVILLSNSAETESLEPLAKEVYSITNAKVNGIMLDNIK